jgi:hypothetical protein
MGLMEITDIYFYLSNTKYGLKPGTSETLAPRDNGRISNINGHTISIRRIG